ncbi:O-antigen ligase [Devosia sp.]|uniref:O-antigen ligase family protein n=1 Tax=Devosia sp. TaxID=1871048 RepID=UPI001B0BAEFB|nr:O-antigen ligase family protein [Devosia sp.]MBO9587056.1 O-antigen ligase family protein [Devosia sp.]
MPHSVRSSVLLVALVATLAMSPVAPEAANVIFLALGVFSVTLMFPRAAEQLRRPIVWMPLLGLGLIALSYGIGARSFEGLVGLAFFSPVFAIWPLLTVAEDIKSEDSSLLIATFALAGVSGAAVVAILEVVATGTVRAGGGVANPIHFADVALLVGFMACSGMVGKKGFWRFLFLLGPVFATVAVVLSGTRGAVVAIAGMLAVAAIGLVVLRQVSAKKALIALAVLVVGGAAALLLGASQLSGVQRVLIDIAEVLQHGLPTDESTAIRLQMIAGGTKAFLQSPIFGHGPLAFVNLANELSELPFGSWPHLHNDLADFAASAGVLGLVAYVLFLLAPIAEAARAPKSEARPRILVLASTLVGGFFIMGLTNAMFGILTVTVTYAVICIVIGILARQASNA